MSQSLSLYKQECDIMERFDFAKVAAIMKVMDWKYAGSLHSPTISDLQYTAERLMSVIQRDINSTSETFVVASTGGLECAAYCFNGNWKMELKFIPVRCNSII